MKERKNLATQEHKNPFSSEQMKEEILKFFDGEELGGAKHKALFDITSLEQLEAKRGDLVNVIKSDLNSEEITRDLPFYESNLRIAEIQLANKRMDIERNRTELPGYFEAEQFIRNGNEKLWKILQSEIKDKDIISKYMIIKNEIYMELIHKGNR